MGEANRRKKIMKVEAERRWDARVMVVTAMPNHCAGDEGQADMILVNKEIEFEDIETPGANQYGFMVFSGREVCTMIPVQDCKRIDLTERLLKAVTNVH